MVEYPMITARSLKAVLNYDPQNGMFRWKKPEGKKMRPGQVAGWLVNGYRIIQIRNRNYRAGRLAFLYVHGRWPKEIDHINRNPSDDRICNLREASRKDNCANTGHRITNKLKLKGVSRKRNKFRATFRRKSLGVFITPEQAHAAYKNAAEKYYGEYACAF